MCVGYLKNVTIFTNNENQKYKYNDNRYLNLFESYIKNK